ncbi:MAG: phenylalanine--tRNA ligase subunit alpha, partial [Actinobacteria bacterium]|nr:phenylalanine--tRNA ligase subunit alpha [Actinomycetota bacterium]
GQAGVKELSEYCGLSAQEVGKSVRFLELKGWAKRIGETLNLTEAGREAIGKQSADEQLLAALSELGRPATAEELKNKGLDLAKAAQLLKPRGGWLVIKKRTQRKLSLTNAGRKLVEEGVSYQKQINQLTPEVLMDGKWRQVRIRPYDVKLPAAKIQPAKEHPFTRILGKVRRVFLEMGFTQIESPLVESSFWDFDALFQPQDHPARDMQDTFYLARPGEVELPDKDLVDQVKEVHENGGETGSVGWQYNWKAGLAKKAVLRTHTTAATARALAKNPKGPRKVFVIGPVFRRETVDYKHLPVFHQVDGIIVDAQGSLASLLGTLDVFYRKMGFEKFQFRPAFFPYTEPSVEVFVWNDKHQDWMEMGGAGIFRSEVTQPLGCHEPVLAWGLGLERLAMFRLGLNDIRELYYTHLDWLEETPLCL